MKKEEIEKQHEKYKQAKWIVNNPKGYHSEDIKHARILCKGYELAIEHFNQSNEVSDEEIKDKLVKFKNRLKLTEINPIRYKK